MTSGLRTAAAAARRGCAVGAARRRRPVSAVCSRSDVCRAHSRGAGTGSFSATAGGGGSTDAAAADDLVELAKRRAAEQAVDDACFPGCRVGIGSGSTIVYAVERLAQRARAAPGPGGDPERAFTCVPTSFQAQELIVQAGLGLSDLARTPQLDVAIDGADEVDAELNCIKGGGACLVQEKVVASCARQFVLIADFRKQSEVLGTSWTRGVPVEVLPFAYVPVANKMKALLGGRAELRMAGAAKAGPVVTDNGNFVLDVEFGAIDEPAKLHSAMLHIPGVVDTGLFPGMAQRAYFGLADGSVAVRDK